MNTKQSLRRPEEVTPIFGLRYLEEEEAEVNGITGCNVPELPPDDNGNPILPPTYYTTNCDYADYD